MSITEKVARALCNTAIHAFDEGFAIAIGGKNLPSKKNYTTRVNRYYREYLKKAERLLKDDELS